MQAKKFPFDSVAFSHHINNLSPSELAARMAQYQAAYEALFANP
jgi:hypothetical protein